MTARIRIAALLAATVTVILAGFVAPAGATTTVSKEQREVVIFTPGLAKGDALESAFYDFVQFNAVALASAVLGPFYKTVHIVPGAAATRSGLANKLEEIASRSTTRAVDLVFITHGLRNGVLLGDRLWTMGEVRDRIRAVLTTSERAKLRMVFSTACFGSSHRAGWRDAGFKAVSGSRQVYADSAASYLPFLSTWAILGKSFQASVNAANTAGSLSGWDQAAAAWFTLQGSGFATQVDSFRLASGTTSLTISTMP